MKKGLFFLLCTTAFFILHGCIGKDSEPFLNGKITLELLSGGNQTEIIGKKLPLSIKLKVLQNGSIPLNVQIYFKTNNCNDATINSVLIDKNGIVEYTWRLDDVVGEQKLVAYAYYENIPYDSIVVKATAKPVENSLVNISSCLPFNSSPYPIFSGDGKTIWAIYSYDGRLAFSKNSGRSWQIKPQNFRNLESFAVSKNDMFWIYKDTLFTSNDEGNTSNKYVLPEAFKTYSFYPKLFATNAKRLIASFNTNGNNYYSYTRPSVGATWKAAVGVDYISKVVETNSGRLFCLGSKNGLTNNNFFFSDDAGLSWKPVVANLATNLPALNFVENIFVNSKNELFTYSWTQNGAIFKSTNDGNNWSYETANTIPIYQIQEYNNQMYFITISQYQRALYKTTDFINNQIVLSSGNFTTQPFLIANDGMLILPFPDNIYYKPIL